MKTYKERIKELREDSEPKVSQQEIANYLGISDTTYQSYEYGTTEPKANIIIQLAKFYRVSSDYILGLTNIKKPYPRP